ncbi:MAG: carbohydrate porin [Candidatus Acidiferrales bacterium]
MLSRSSISVAFPQILATILAFFPGAFSPVARAQSPGPPATPPDASSSPPPVTLLPHSDSSRWWISGQANIVLQWHSTFPAAYSGPNSFGPKAQSATSKVYSLYTGFELTHTTEVFLDIESAGGHGLSEALGLAGFTNLDVVRNPALGPAPYLARVMIRQIIPLSKQRVPADRDFLHLATSLPVRRLEFRVGKFGIVDFLDANSGGTDSHLQFLNWVVDDDGAYDYAANTRGYTDGALVEYDDHRWSIRFVEALMPKVANGLNLDANLARSRSENLELEYGGGFLHHRDGAIRVLSYVNTADMGNYREAIEQYNAHEVKAPNIIATRQEGRQKYGFELNLEQDLTAHFGVFSRLGWSDGRNESFAYTEVDRTAEVGDYFRGDWWHRANDRAGTVFVINGIVGDHRVYLADGGLGFLLGDGALTYGQEKIFEGYYTLHMWRGLFSSFDAQHINNPGYNKARGPVWVPGLRLHVDF